MIQHPDPEQKFIHGLENIAHQLKLSTEGCYIYVAGM